MKKHFNDATHQKLIGQLKQRLAKLQAYSKDTPA